MKIQKGSKTIIFASREDEVKCMVAKVKNSYEVYVDGKNTGYKFRSIKKALEYCEYGF